MNRRRFLKIIPAGLLSSFLPVKLFGSSEKLTGKRKNETLNYQVDGVNVEQTTFYYTKEDLPPDKTHYFAEQPDYFYFTGKKEIDIKYGYRRNVRSLFFDKDGNQFPYDGPYGGFSGSIYEKNVSKNPRLYIPENAVSPKVEWINKEVLLLIKMEMANQPLGKPPIKLFVYIFLREDSPAVGFLVDTIPHKSYLLSYGPV